MSVFLVLCPQLSGISYLLIPVKLTNPLSEYALISIKSPALNFCVGANLIKPSLFASPYVKLVTAFAFTFIIMS